MLYLGRVAWPKHLAFAYLTICSVLALSKRNTNAAEVILFLHRLVQVLVEYFKELEEESIRDNFVIIYELLDEMMDFGYPQTTESKILQEYALFVNSNWDLCLHVTVLDTLLKSHINSKSKYDHLWLSHRLYHGDRKVFDTGRTKCSWMLLRVSTYWCVVLNEISSIFSQIFPTRLMQVVMS